MLVLILMVQPPSWLLAQPLPVHVGPALMLVLIFIAQPPLKRLPHTEPQPPPPALMLVLIFIAQPPCCGQPPGQWPALTLVLIFMVVLSVEVSYDLETRRPSPGPKEPTRRRSRAPHDGRRATQPGRPALSPNRCRASRVVDSDAAPAVAVGRALEITARVDVAADKGRRRSFGGDGGWGREGDPHIVVPGGTRRWARRTVGGRIVACHERMRGGERESEQVLSAHAEEESSERAAVLRGTAR